MLGQDAPDRECPQSRHFDWNLGGTSDHDAEDSEPFQIVPVQRVRSGINRTGEIARTLALAVGRLVFCY
jgi:hypothetical protein